MTREQATADMLSQLVDLKCEVIDLVMDWMQKPDLAEKLRERFLKAGEKYGAFDPKSIDVEAEKEAEILDLLSYCYLGKLQNAR